MPSFFTGTTPDDSIEVRGTPASGPNYSAQSVELDAWTIDSVVMRLIRASTPADNIVCSLQADASNAPSGTPLVSDSIVGSTLNEVAIGSSAFYTFDLGYTVTTGKYWVVFKRSGSGSDANYYAVPLISSNPYADGALGYEPGVVGFEPEAFGGGYDICLEVVYTEGAPAAAPTLYSVMSPQRW